MEKKPTQSQKRAASPCADNEPTSKKKKSSYNRVTKNLTRALAEAVKDHLVLTHNEKHREECLRILDAKNGSEAGKKFEQLAEQFKAGIKRKAVKGNSEKINENSP